MKRLLPADPPPPSLATCSTCSSPSPCDSRAFYAFHKIKLRTVWPVTRISRAQNSFKKIMIRVQDLQVLPPEKYLRTETSGWPRSDRGDSLQKHGDFLVIAFQNGDVVECLFHLRSWLLNVFLMFSISKYCKQEWCISGKQSRPGSGYFRCRTATQAPCPHAASL